MALFQRRPQASDPVNYVSFSLNKTILIAGLGNIGKEYDDTRHNIGFACVDEFAKVSNFPNWIVKKDFKCLFASQTLGQNRVILIKPATMMNLSGEAVQAAASFYKIATGNICVVHDELDVPFGQIRTRAGGSSAGHNGIKSVIEHLGEDFSRARVGIGTKKPAQMDSADFVLQKFSASEQKNLAGLKKEAAAILSEYAYSNQPIPAETRSFLV